jgi:autotransporter translocation and assembly factor TamB
MLLIGLLMLALVSTQTRWFKDWLRRYVSREAEQYLNAQLVIERIDGNLFTGIELERVSLVQGGETVLAAKDVGLDYNALDLISGGVVIDAIRINEPVVLLKRGADGWNLAGLVKEQASEADREGPARPVHIGTIGISNGTVTIVDTGAKAADAPRLPRRIARIDLKGSFDYKPVDFTIDIAHVSFRASEPDLALNSLSGRVTVNNDDVRVDRLAVRTEQSALAAHGSIRQYLKTPVLDVNVSSERLTPREFSGFVPTLATVRVDPAFELTARGSLEALDTTFNVRTSAGAARGRLLADGVGPTMGAKGDLAIEHVNLSGIVDDLPASDVNGRSTLDVTVDARSRLMGRVQVDVSPTTVAGYRVEAVDARATLDGERARVDGTLTAYGARATAKGSIVPPMNGQALAVDLEGRASGVDLRRLPRSLGAPALATRIGARYEVDVAGRRSEGALTFDESTVEGATIAAGTQARAALEGDRLTFSARGALRDVDPKRLGDALRIPALADERARATIDAGFDVDGRARTARLFRTLDANAHVTLPDASIAGGTVRDGDIRARLLNGALDATMTARFASLDPALASQRPDLAGAVTGTLDATVALPDVSAPALSTASGKVQLALEPSRVGSQTVDRGLLDASLSQSLLDVRKLELAGPLAEVSASGPVSLAEDGQSKLSYRVEARDLTALGALAGGVDVGGSATTEGTLTGNLDELRAAGTLSGASLRYATTARAVGTDVRYDVTLPKLDVREAHGRGTVKTSLVEAAGRSIREVTLEAQYANREASFETKVTETAERSLEARGAVSLQPTRTEVRFDRLALAAPDVSWTTSAPARVVYGDGRVDVDRLQLVSGDQRLDVGGSVTLPAGSDKAATVPVDRPLQITAENVDLAAIDRLAMTGRGLGGRLSASATVAGTLDAPLADAKVSVRDGAFGEFKYRTLDATVHHDASAARVEARLDQGASSLDLRGTLPTLMALRSETGGRTAPIDVRLETSPIDLAVLQAFTTAVRDLKGTLQANVHVTGALSAPVAEGTVGVTGGAFTIAAADTRFTGLEADVALHNDRVDVKRFELADSDGQRLALTGAVGVSLAERTLGRVDMQLKGERFKLLDGDLGRLAVDVDLGVRGEPSGLRAQGTVAVRDGRIEIDRVLALIRPQAPVIATPDPASTPAAAPAPTPPPPSTPAPTTAPATETTAPATATTAAAPASAAAPALLDAIALDVRLTVPNNLVLRGDQIKVGGEGLSLGNVNMTVGGDLRAVRRPGRELFVVGNVHTIRGVYEFQGRRFDLVRDGTVSFKGPDPANPQLDVSATRDISGVEARVRVHGEAQRPELELSSAPPLDQADILSLIIFNRPINDLGQGEKTTLAARAGSLVGGFVAAPVAEALRDALDVDLLEITPVTDEGGGPSVSIGNQIGERVFVKIQQQFGASEVTQLVLEYELSQLLRLQTSVAQGGDTTRSVGRRTERGGADLVFVIKY